MPVTPLLPGRTYRSAVRNSRLLFNLRASRDLLVSPLTGQGPATGIQSTILSRPGGSSMTYDSLGRPHLLVHSAPRFMGWDSNQDGVREESGLLIEGAILKNICPFSEAAASWTKIGGTGTATVDHAIGDLSLSLITDADAASQVGFTPGNLTQLFSTSAAKALSFFIQQVATNNSASGVRIRLQDTTAVAGRVVLNVTWNADGTPNVSVSTGVLLGVDKLYLDPVSGPLFRIRVQSTAVTAANTHRIEAYAAGVGPVTETGSVFVGGFQAEDNTYCQGYVPTPASASVSTTTDTVMVEHSLLNVGLITLYMRFVNLYKLSTDADFPALLTVGSDSANGIIRMFYGSTLFGASVKDDAGTLYDHPNRLATVQGQVVEMTFAAKIGQFLNLYNGDLQQNNVTIKASSFPTFTQTNPRIQLGTGWQGLLVFDAKVAAGFYTPAQMRQMT